MGKILLVENIGLVCIKFKKTLKNFGYEQANTLSGPELMSHNNDKLIKLAEIIFIDSDNREYKVNEIIDTIKSHNKKAYIIIITSQGSIDFIKKLRSFGCHDILAKPYSDNKLMEKVFKYLEAPTINNVGDVIQEISLENNGRYMPEWNIDLELGIESIDNEHHELIERYETLYQKMKTGEGSDYCLELLKYLENYVNTHFENEENFFKRIDYNYYLEHKLMHDSFKLEISKIPSQLNNKKFDIQQQVKFNLFIKKWWMHHILVEDKKYVEFYKV